MLESLGLSLNMRPFGLSGVQSCSTSKFITLTILEKGLITWLTIHVRDGYNQFRFTHTEVALVVKSNPALQQVSKWTNLPS